MSKTEIMEELARLSAEDLAEVRARLDQLVLDKTAKNPNAPAARAAARIRSPRLADVSRAGDFTKLVTQLPSHAQL